MVVNIIISSRVTQDEVESNRSGLRVHEVLLRDANRGELVPTARVAGAPHPQKLTSSLSPFVMLLGARSRDPKIQPRIEMWRSHTKN
jgi:hypothetical protein